MCCPTVNIMYPFRRWSCLIHSGKYFGRTSASTSSNSNSPSLKRFPIAHTAGNAASLHNANATRRHIWLNETKYSSVKISLFPVYYIYIPTYQRHYISQPDVRCSLQRVAIACLNFVLHTFRLWLCKNEKSDNYISICLERDALDSWALAHWIRCEVQFSIRWLHIEIAHQHSHTYTRRRWQRPRQQMEGMSNRYHCDTGETLETRARKSKFQRVLAPTPSSTDTTLLSDFGSSGDFRWCFCCHSYLVNAWDRYDLHYGALRLIDRTENYY